MTLELTPEQRTDLAAADIPDALRWDVSHARRTLRGQPLPILQDALRMESQRYRPRKRLQKWLQDEIIGQDDIHILGEYKEWMKSAAKRLPVKKKVFDPLPPEALPAKPVYHNITTCHPSQ